MSEPGTEQWIYDIGGAVTTSPAVADEINKLRTLNRRLNRVNIDKPPGIKY